MNNNEKVLHLAQTHNGTVTTSMVTEAGLPRYCLKQLVDQNLLMKAGRGVYVLPAVWEDELFVLQNTYRKGIFSHETALWLLAFSDRTPQKYTMTFPLGYHAESLADKIYFKQASKDIYNLGVSMVLTPGGHEVSVYSIERTLCDIVRGKNNVDIQLVQPAMKKYLSLKDRNIHVLLNYAEALRVLKKIRFYVEALV
ncbi:MAG TPA: type IV toxin-antitoxin system AbiEi family antitoxin domain-containing protein [Treponemataceae bacterium]|nr:type IV toxin-antitoxin system AbiEi family antitoxin domain-containing protein [Treponemataceae bacterium]